MAEADPNPVAKKTSDLASRDTPLIRNQWYVAARSEEVTRKPMRRTILDQDIALYRGEDGTPIALQNRCAHRSYPLNLGELKGDRIVCGYHGFEFGKDGRCAYVPSLDAARPSIRIQPYPVVEIGPFIWIWTGDPDAVDHGKLIDQPWMTEQGWWAVHGYMHMKANYLGLHENLMDSTHFAFLHSFGRGNLALARNKQKIEVLPDTVIGHLVVKGTPVLPAMQRVTKLPDFVDDVGKAMFLSPAMVIGASTITHPDDESNVANRRVVHCMTPESATSTHYFWAIACDFGLDDVELKAENQAFGEMAFKEDADALAEIERLIEREDRPGVREALIQTDHGGVQVLRMIARIAAEEIATQRAENVG